MRLAPWIAWCALAGSVLGAPEEARPPAAVAPHPLDLFQDCVALSPADFSRVDRGDAVVRSLDAGDNDVAVFGAKRTEADGPRLVAWVRQIAALKRSPLVEAITRFSEPPRATDLAGLSLDPGDQDALRECRPERCRLKLTADEIERVRLELADAESLWRSRADVIFRTLMFDRILAYRSSGHGAAGAYADGRSPESLEDVAADLRRQSACLTDRVPALARAIAGAPLTGGTSPDAFLYWSKERVSGRPIVSMTHVAIIRTGPGDADAIVAGKQVSATHYLTGSLNITAVIGAGPGSAHYLVILNRSRLDVLSGLFGFFARRSIERRMRSELPGILDQMVRRLESGPPPATEYSRDLDGPGREPSNSAAGP